MHTTEDIAKGLKAITGLVDMSGKGNVFASRKPESRSMIVNANHVFVASHNIVGARNAKKAIGDRLPKRGEIMHGISKGQSRSIDFIPVVIEMAGSPCDRLDVTTLGFVPDAVDQLRTWVSTGMVGKIGIFVCSSYHQTNSPEITQGMRKVVESTGGTMIAAQCHTKVFVLEFPNDIYTFEMSANLSSCRNIEQFTLSADQSVADFHRGWMTELGRSK